MLISWFKLVFGKLFKAEDPVRRRARLLISSIDAGGLPTDPILINRIGRALGLDISPSDPMPLTIQRIRECLAKS